MAKRMAMESDLFESSGACSGSTKRDQVMTTKRALDPAADLRASVHDNRFACILADPPWQFINRTGKVAPEHRRLSRYGTMDAAAICSLPVADITSSTAHLYLWVPNALLPDGLKVMQAWGFQYKSNIVWRKIRKDGGSDGRGVGFYFRNVTEILLFGVRGKNARTLQPGRTQVNYLETRKREHSRKPDEMYVTCRCFFPPRRIRVRPSEGRTDEASKVH
jgi:N6-adenosine-specific RNA methylase IME4